MPETVQFVMVLQIGEVAVHAVENVVGVKVAVVQLRRAHDVDGRVGCGLEFGVGMMGQRVADRFDPLGEVGVLEHESIEFVRVGIGRVFRQRLEAAEGVFRRHEGLALLVTLGILRGRGLEVVHAVAGDGTGNVVVQRIPLIWNHHGAYELLLGGPERVGDGGVAQRDWMAVAVMDVGHERLSFRAGVVVPAGPAFWSCPMGSSTCTSMPGSRPHK